jgi:zona occludens toxin (predicted ATPase)
MIIIHEGVPGSGKSYDGVRKILDALRAGRVVYSNIDGLQSDVCQEYISQKLGITRDALTSQLVHLPDNSIHNFWDHCEYGSFVVIDEAQNYFNSRDFVKDANREFGKWASTHRHHGYDLLLITQRAERIDTAVRSLAEFRYRYRKLNVFGSLVQKGYLIYTYAGEDPKHLGMRKATYDVSIFPCYQSYVGDATEKKVVKLPNLLNHPIFYALAVVLVCVFYFGSKSPLLHGDLSMGMNKKKPSVSSPVVPDPSSLPLEKAKRQPAIAETLSPSPEIVDTSLQTITLPLDGLIITSKGAFMTSGGYRLSGVISYDRDLMQATIPSDKLPSGLRVAMY